jgi:hypothetical protein
MIEFVITLDYELYGDGTGSLKEQVYDPADLLLKVFKARKIPMVIFVEAAEIEMIQREKSDRYLDLVLDQLRWAYNNGFELGLHLHPQWYRARYKNGNWVMEESDYNLCRLPAERIREVVSRAINFLKMVLADRNFTPISFRAGNWLFQPTQPAASILYDHGIRIDSSVFQGGRFKDYGVDYRKADFKKYYWKFWEDAAVSSESGKMYEIPIYTRMVPFWQMLTTKRLELEKSGYQGLRTEKGRVERWFSKFKNYLSLKYPQKLDFCRMTAEELRMVLEEITEKDRRSPEQLKPIVTIGHTKDLRTFDAVNYLLEFLDRNEIKTTTFKNLYPRLASG